MCLAIPFGIKDNQLVDVDSVESGLKCNCTCPVCKSRLVAKKGRYKVHHFAHYNDPGCKGALETSLHLAAKEILIKERHIKLPRLFLGNYSDDYDGILISDTITISFDRVKLEKKIGEIIPDLIIEAKDHKLLIEIEVTHKITDSKLKKIKDLNCMSSNQFSQSVIKK